MLIYQINQTVKQTRPDVLLDYYELASVFHHATVVDIIWSQLSWTLGFAIGFYKFCCVHLSICLIGSLIWFNTLAHFCFLHKFRVQETWNRAIFWEKILVGPKQSKWAFSGPKLIFSIFSLNLFILILYMMKGI